MELVLKSLESIHETAKEFIELTKSYTVTAFYGEMGAGKTTFIKALCNELNVTDQVSSPTFAIVNEYKTTEARPLFHFDFYRIKTIEEVYDFGYEEYFYSGEICYIEWPELIEELLPENCLKVKISENKDGSRAIKLNNNTF